MLHNKNAKISDLRADLKNIKDRLQICLHRSIELKKQNDTLTTNNQQLTVQRDTLTSQNSQLNQNLSATQQEKDTYPGYRFYTSCIKHKHYSD